MVRNSPDGRFFNARRRPFSAGRDERDNEGSFVPNRATVVCGMDRGCGFELERTNSRLSPATRFRFFRAIPIDRLRSQLEALRFVKATDRRPALSVTPVVGTGKSGMSPCFEYSVSHKMAGWLSSGPRFNGGLLKAGWRRFSGPSGKAMRRTTSVCMDSLAEKGTPATTERVFVFDDLDRVISRARNGDPSDFEELYKRFNWFVLEVVRAYCPVDAEDVAQQVWMVIRESLSKFDPAKASFHWWLRVIARRKSISAADRRMRYENTLRRLRDRAVEDGVEAEASPDAFLHAEETEKAIADCAGRLRARRREVFCLVSTLGLSRQEAARRLGIREKRVRSILSEARAQILECLRKKGVL